MNLSIDPNIVSDWGLWEAVREIIQGAIDECGNDYIIEYDENEQKLTVLNDGKLTRSSLLIGHSTKRDDKTKIGQHGEGYKNSVAILLRENKIFRIYNDDEVWNFSYKYDKRFKSNVIAVDIKNWFVKKTKSIAWEISNITLEEFDHINKHLCNYCDIRGTNGDILINEPGNIYSGGLFVCNKSELGFGYNFDIGVLQLQRDRNLLNDYDIYYETTKCWLNSDDILTHAKNGLKDVFYLNIHIKSQSLSDKAYDIFTHDYGVTAYPVVHEVDKIKNVKNVIVPCTYRDLIVNSSKFTRSSFVVHTPTEILLNWVFNDDLNIEKLKKIIEDSKEWQIK